MDWYHLFCEGRVRPESDCPHEDARGEEYARLSPEGAKWAASLPEEERWRRVNFPEAEENPEENP